MEKSFTYGGKRYLYTTNHPTSSYGMAVVVDSDGEPIGPGDMLIVDDGESMRVVFGAELYQYAMEVCDEESGR